MYDIHCHGIFKNRRSPLRTVLQSMQGIIILYFTIIILYTCTHIVLLRFLNYLMHRRRRTRFINSWNALEINIGSSLNRPTTHHPSQRQTHAVPYIPQRPPKTRLDPADSMKWANSSRAHPIWKSVSPLQTRKQLRVVECPGRQVGGLSPEHTYVCGSAARCCRACASLKVAFLFIFYISLHFNNCKLLFLLLVFFLFLYFYTKYDVYRDRGMYVYTYNPYIATQTRRDRYEIWLWEKTSKPLKYMVAPCNTITTNASYIIILQCIPPT